ncbi:hypothetical protein ACNGTO_01140 [Bisgaard Taxon 45]|uniref:hypothetical protein n=1 Tax=Pasteurella multocida TaxID=747 RepID=UPI00397BC4CA
MSKLPLFILQLDRRIPVEKVVNRNRIGRQESKKSTKPSIKKNRAKLPPFVRKTYPNGIYQGILQERGQK